MPDSYGETLPSDEQGLRAAIEDFFFGYRMFTSLPDAMLAARGLGRTHHRILYFVRRDPGTSVGELLATLGITKQAAHGPLKKLEAYGLIAAEPDADDRRVRRLTITPAGHALEAELSAAQMRLLADAFAAAGPEATAGWRAVMAQLR